MSSDNQRLQPGEVGTANQTHASSPSLTTFTDRQSISSDDGELSHTLEVLLDQEAVHRRKSSLVASDYSARPKTPRKLTSCYVHQLLEKHRVGDGTYTPSIEGVNAAKRLDKDPNGNEEARHTESRLLTKKQLSEMALGIRELSKKLAHLKIKLKVKNIFVLTKVHDQALIGCARELTRWLLEKDQNYSVYVENILEKEEAFDAKGMLADDPSFQGRLKWWDEELCQRKPHAFDIVIAVSALNAWERLVANVA